MHPFEALADPVRRDILGLLRHGERPAGALVNALGLPQPRISRHLKALRQAGLVRARIDGPRRLCRLDPTKLDAWLASYRVF